MTKYREIIRLAQPELKLSQQKIAFSCGVSKKTINKVLKAASEKNISWPLPASYTDAFLEELLFPGKREQFIFVGMLTYSQYPYVEAFLDEKQGSWITAALRNEQFFSLPELNADIKKKLEEFSRKPFQKKEGSRYEIFRDEELPLLAKLPDAPYELAEWKTATVACEVARGSTAPSRSICRKITRSIWSGMATVSAAGLHGSAIIQTRS